MATVIPLYVLAVLGYQNPLSWLIAGPLVAVMVAMLLVRLPILGLWAVPITLIWYVYLPLLHYEFLVVLLALSLMLKDWPKLDWLRMRTQSVEFRYLLFLLATLPGVIGVVSLWRYFGAIKLLGIGLLGFVVARRAAQRFGTERMLWGPAIFALITSFVLLVRAASSDLPTFKQVIFRVPLSQLSWGSSNYVAAVLVLCLPALVLLIRQNPPRSWRRGAALGTLVAAVGAMFVTTSRGGIVLGAGYLVAQTLRPRRLTWRPLVVILLLVAATIATPHGQFLISRFTSPQGIASALARYWGWHAAFERGVGAMPFGVGAGQGRLQNDRLGWIDPHNYLLTLFSEHGILCLALWLWLFWTLYMVSRGDRSSAGARLAGDALRATLILAFLNLQFEPIMTGSHYHLLFWWLVGIYAGSLEPAAVAVLQRSGPRMNPAFRVATEA
ncbi:MAG TPA: hypothetical protein VEY91_01375 [Candidatus Limnocylindria bacterium]|nr:hypothetical protein [Candidatus Limnocylindria bacterium]